MNFTAQIPTSGLEAEEELFTLKSQAATVFSKCKMSYGWQNWNGQAVSNSDYIITLSIAKRY